MERGSSPSLLGLGRWCPWTSPSSQNVPQSFWAVLESQALEFCLELKVLQRKHRGPPAAQWLRGWHIRDAGEENGQVYPTW